MMDHNHAPNPVPTVNTSAPYPLAGKCRIFSGSVLKLIAMITMLIDHTAVILLSDREWATTSFEVVGISLSVYSILRRIGRLAFPIFCFLIVEGFIHTKDRRKYGLSLALFAVISEIPFNLMVSGQWACIDKQNVFFTLLLGVVLLCILEYVHPPYKQAACLIALCIAAYILHADYGLRGVLLIGMLYVLRGQTILQTLFAYPMLSGGVAAWCAFVPINMYNGKRGFIQGKPLKYAFYLFYPLHILLLLIVKQWMT